MSLFGKLIKTIVNVAALPVDIVKDVVTLGNVAGDGEPFTVKRLEKIVDEADEADED